MNSRVILSHHTRYQYDRPVFLGRQTVRLCPVSRVRSAVRNYALEVSPEGADVVWRQDAYGNRVAEVRVPDRVTGFDIAVSMEVDLGTQSDALVTTEAPACTVYRAVDAAGVYVSRFVEAWRSAGAELTSSVVADLNRAVAERLTYQRRLEPGVWTPEETLQRGSGSCRDSAWLLVTVLRHLGFSARFVSGYLVQSDTTEGLSCDLHAWAEAWIPGQGWVGFDTTSGLMVAQHHVPLAVGGRPEEAAPVSGMLDRCRATFDVTMRADTLPSGKDFSELAMIGKPGVMRSHEAL
ncbi:transglutaminase family protein [Gluconobacter sp. Dm-62]|uniref:transglutaminase family protein n=1 Tax=Gluconobacter sp. Dm-62 TaxID=2799804 RepID=UPI001B8B9FC2|nr:transglutaminase family protein [Gluconobacter sp. Dm-62]MBS1103133.1 transglutaminase family protein [Gluconobacter sp. Dm-62]